VGWESLVRHVHDSFSCHPPPPNNNPPCQIQKQVAVPPDVGVNTFEYVVDAPDHTKIPASDILGVTVVMVQALYKGKEFVRVGYYVKVDYADEKLREEPPEVECPDVALLERNILAAEPRVTRYLVEWDNAPTTEAAESMSEATTPEQQAAAAAAAAAANAPLDGKGEAIAQPQFAPETVAPA